MMRSGLFGDASAWAIAAGASLLLVASAAGAATTDKSAPPSGGVVLAANETAAAETTAASAVEQVTVTARRVAENMQDVPVAISAYSGEKIEALVINNNLDISKLSANLMTDAAYGSPYNTQAAIRGFGGTATGGVVQYFAEVPNYELTYFDLANVQVLKGPQGTLFGESLLGGAILYEPQKPTNTFGGYARVEAGNYNEHIVEGAINLPLVPDKFMVRISGENRQRDGYNTAYQTFAANTPIQLDNIDDTHWRVEATFRPFDKLENFFMYSGNIIKSNGTAQYNYWFDPVFLNPFFANSIPANNPFGLNPSPAAVFQALTGYAPPAGQTWAQLLQAAHNQQIGLGPRLSFVDFNQMIERTFTGFVNQTKWDILDNLTARNIVSLYYTSTQNPVVGDYDGTDLPILDSGRVYPRNNNDWVGGFPSRTVTEEFQLLGKLFNDRLKWQAGVYYRESGSRAWGPNPSGFVFFGGFAGISASAATCAFYSGPPACTIIQRTIATNYATYAQGTFALTPKINFTAGFRVSWDNARTDTSVSATDFGNVGGLNLAINRVNPQQAPGAKITSSIIPTSEHVTYNFTADWKVLDHVLLYAATRTGYIAGGINSLGTTGVPFGPETDTNYEIGMKADWAFGDFRGRTNVSLYHDDFTNIQRQSFVTSGTPPVPFGITENNAAARYQGIEIENLVVPTAWFEIQMNLGLEDNKYTKWTENDFCSGSTLPSCLGMPGITPYTIDHVAGVLTIGATTFHFTPDQVPNSPKVTWSLQPKLKFKEWTGQDISITADIYSRTSYTAFAASSSLVAGYPIAPQIQPSLYGGTVPLPPTETRGYTLVDLRADWNTGPDHRIDAYAAVTNLLNTVYPLGISQTVNLLGSTLTVPSIPRMVVVGASFKF